MSFIADFFSLTFSRSFLFSVYPADPQINLDGSLFHKSCAKCSDCKCQITLSNFAKNETSQSTTLLCKTHYFQRFNQGGGNYVGGEKYHTKTNRCAMFTFQGVKINESPDPNRKPNYFGASPASSSTQGTPRNGNFSIERLRSPSNSSDTHKPSDALQSTIDLFNRPSPSPAQSPRTIDREKNVTPTSVPHIAASFNPSPTQSPAPSISSSTLQSDSQRD